MTGLLHEKEFSRKSFVKAGGALFVGFSVFGAGVAGRAQAAGESPFASDGPAALNQVDSFIVVHSDNTATIMTGGGEHGAGTGTGWLMLAGEELGMDMSQLTLAQVDSNITPTNITTSNTMSTKYIGANLRAAAASARLALLNLASSKLGTPVQSLSVKSGVVSGNGQSVTYGALIGSQLFNVTIPGAPQDASTVSKLAPLLMQGTGEMKDPSQYFLVGTRVPRIDIPAIVSGSMVYSTSVRVPGMLHGRIVFPRGQGGFGQGAPVVSVDATSISHLPDVQIVRRGDFVGVVAPKEYDAIQAAAQLKVVWADPPVISGDGNLWSKMRADDAAGLAPARYQGGTPVGNVDSALAAAARVVAQTYSFPYNIHGPIGPGCCVADVTPNGAAIYLHTQYPAATQTAVAQITGLPQDLVRVRLFPGSSHYGGAFARSDAALAAAVMSQGVGKPVRVQFMRWDENGWDNHGPVQLIDLRAGIDVNGKLVAWDSTEFGVPTSAFATYATTNQLVGLPVPTPGNGQAYTWGSGNAQSPYNLPNWRDVAKTLPLVNNYFKTATMRSSVMATTFGTEQLVDELAHAANMDPIAFRRLNVSSVNTDRLLAVLDALQQISGWKPKVAASNLSSDTVVTGRGVAFGSFWSPPTLSGAVADVQVNKKTGRVLVTHVYAAQDQGLAVNPASIENQMSGMSVQAVSRTIWEEVKFNTKRVTSLDWVSYPILRFKDTPKVTTAVIQRPTVVMSGAGDDTINSIPAAIANAFFDATGVRMRTAPMSPARVRAVLAAGGSATAGTA
jgi:nicotinate dehydrogenase subunit B